MTATTSTTYRLPLPPRGSGSNARGRWVKSKAAREYREECAEAYRKQGVPEVPFDRVHVDLEMRVCRQRVPAVHPGPSALVNGITYRQWVSALDRYRPVDAGNVFDACKAALDALQPERWIANRNGPRLVAGAGVVVEDTAKHMSLGAPGLVEVASFADEGVWVTVTEVRHD